MQPFVPLASFVVNTVAVEECTEAVATAQQSLTKCSGTAPLLSLRAECTCDSRYGECPGNDAASVTMPRIHGSFAHWHRPSTTTPQDSDVASLPIPMRNVIHRIASLPGWAIATAASMLFASSQVWAQAAPRQSNEGAPRLLAATPSIAGEVRNMVIKGDSIEITYANTGTAPTTIIGEVQVHVSEDEIAASLPFADTVTVRSGATQRFRVAMPKLAKGRYTLLAIVDYGGEHMTAARATLDMR